MRSRALAVLVAVLALGGCRSELRQGTSATPAPRAATRPRVVLLSLDGADAATLHDLERRGELTGGFARLRREGEEAAALLPVDPTVTSTNHVSLVTGFPPGRTGIVGNKLHLHDAPWTSTVSGFATPIGTETLWEATRRQGRRTVVLTWPGADGTSERRRGDRGVEWGGDAPTVVHAYPPSYEAELSSEGRRWPGTPADARLERWLRGEPDGEDVDAWVAQSEQLLGFLGDLWRREARRDDWDLLLAYAPTLDEAGHRLLLVDPRQWGYSPQRRDAFARARMQLWHAVDQELLRFLDAVDLTRTIVVVVSDHGMIPIHTRVDVNALLRDRGLLVRSGDGLDAEHTRAFAAADAALAHVYVRAGADQAALVDQLAAVFRDWRVDGQPVLERVLRRDDLAGVGLDSPDAGDLVLWTRPGYNFSGGWGDAGNGPARSFGTHGFFLADEPRMRAIFFAAGPGVPHRELPALRNLEVAPRVAGWLGIEPPRAVPPAAEVDPPAHAAAYSHR